MDSCHRWYLWAAKAQKRMDSWFTPGEEAEFLSFDLADGYTALAFAESERHYFTVNIRGRIYQTAALNFGLSISACENDDFEGALRALACEAW